MSKYIDGFVIPLPKDKVPPFDCKRMAYGGLRTIVEA